MYGGNNNYGDSGTIELDLVRKFAGGANDDSPISFFL